jgi:hypothetical protein
MFRDPSGKHVGSLEAGAVLVKHFAACVPRFDAPIARCLKIAGMKRGPLTGDKKMSGNANCGLGGGCFFIFILAPPRYFRRDW